MSGFETLSPTELRDRLAADAPPVVLDVREHGELAVCSLDGAVHVPMGEIVARVDELDPAAEIVCMCHHGVRSARVASFLVSQGFERVWNLSGGIDRWAEDVDPAMARY